MKLDRRYDSGRMEHWRQLTGEEIKEEEKKHILPLIYCIHMCHECLTWDVIIKTQLVCKWSRRSCHKRIPVWNDEFGEACSTHER
jgi:hypothetical protein